MAGNFVASAAANAVGNLATEYAAPYVSYFFRFGKIVEDFKSGRNQLKLKKDRVQNDVDEAIRQTETADFPQVGRRAPLEGIEFLLSNDHFLPSESSKAAFSGIIKALSGDGVNMVGLYGMPGVGKTTLAEQVGKHAREQKLFDKVLIFTVSRTPNINKIQDKIAESLGLKFEAATEAGRAEELLRRLRSEQKMFIIVDDVWDPLEMKFIGIPFGDEHEGCKIF
ncbi:hypothetical protein PTKIN_Ptkin11bG0177200 [Pterospermum kingtungense]